MSSRLTAFWLSLALFLGTTAAASAQATEPGVVIPNFWDKKRRIERPDLDQRKIIRFVTEDDYPPFHFNGPDGQLMGFEVDLARAICRELTLECSIQARLWNNLSDALAQRQGDAIIASLRISAQNRASFAMTTSYYRTPARFLIRNGGAITEPTPEKLAGRRVAVVSGSAHEAYLRAFFPAATPVPQLHLAALLDAVRLGEVDIGFADGVGVAIWLNGEASNGCCSFVGGPYTESRYFGEGAGIAVRRDDPKLAQAIDWALARLAANGTYATLYLRYFPIGFY